MTPAEMAPGPDILIEDPVLAAGYTMIPNAILRNPGLSLGAKTVYGLLLSYAWQDGSCFPGQDRLAQDIGGGERSVRNYLQELQKRGYISIRRRGLNLTNLYVIHRIEAAESAGPDGAGDAGSAKAADQERQPRSRPKRQNRPATKTQETNTQNTIDGQTDEFRLEPFPIAELGLPSTMVWPLVLDWLRRDGRVPARDVETWLRPAGFRGRDGAALLIDAPNAVARERIAARWLPALQDAVAQTIGVPLEVRVVTAPR